MYDQNLPEEYLQKLAYSQMTFAERLDYDKAVFAKENYLKATFELNREIEWCDRSGGHISDSDGLIILEYVYEIRALDKRHQINANTYKNKVRSYQNIYRKLEQEYGIKYKEALKFPFRNPVDLKTAIDSIFLKSNLSEEQRTIAWRVILGDKNSPNKSQTTRLIEKEADFERFLSDESQKKYHEDILYALIHGKQYKES